MRRDVMNEQQTAECLLNNDPYTDALRYDSMIDGIQSSVGKKSRDKN